MRKKVVILSAIVVVFFCSAISIINHGADPGPTVTPDAPLATALPTATAYPSGGLGLDRDVWERDHRMSGEDLGFTQYDNNQIWVIYMDDTIWHLERVYESETIQPTLDEAREASLSFVPEDSQLVKEYHPHGFPELTVDLYMSESLKDRFPYDDWTEGEPGNFTVIFGVYDGKVPRIVIGTGNNP